MSWDSPPILLQGRASGAPTLAYRILRPKEDAKAVVLLTGGYFENMKRYRAVIERWNSRGIAVVTYDLRGHGMSEGRRGFIARFSDYVDDILAMLSIVEKDDAFRRLGPPVMFGHSLGGLISVHGALHAGKRVSALALSSPYLANAIKVPAVKLIPGRVLSKFVPTLSLPAGVRGEDCTRTREIAEAYEDDPMNFKSANVRWFTETERAQHEAQERAPELKMPILCIHGAADKIAQPAASEHFIVRTSSVDREYILLPGTYHEVLNDPDREKTMDLYAAKFLKWRAAAGQER